MAIIATESHELYQPEIIDDVDTQVEFLAKEIKPDETGVSKVDTGETEVEIRALESLLTHQLTLGKQKQNAALEAFILSYELNHKPLTDYQRGKRIMALESIDLELPIDASENASPVGDLTQETADSLTSQTNVLNETVRMIQESRVKINPNIVEDTFKQVSEFDEKVGLLITEIEQNETPHLKYHVLPKLNEVYLTLKSLRISLSQVI